MKLLCSETAVSEVVGHAIILSITVIGISMITLYGVPAIYSLQDMANVKNVEQSFTVLDSRASRVTLGESPLQITNINLGGGTLTVEPNSTNNTSYMTVKSQNSTFNITIPMGKVKYTLGDRTVAYEGGGVWSQYPGGGSVMLSPPEFHYNGVTLTLPVFNISGTTSVGGKGVASVSFKKNSTIVRFPNTTCAYADCANRTNPVNYAQTGKVYVNITSDYYLAWADYARSLVYTKVDTNATTRTTDIELTVVPSTLGESTPITNPATFRGLDPNDPEPLDDFSFRIYGTPQISALNWQMAAQSGTKTLVIQLQKSGSDIGIRVGYKDTGFSGSQKTEIWKKDNAFTIISGNPQYADIDLLNQTIKLEYEETEVPHGTVCWNYIDKSDFNHTNFTWTDRIVNDSATYKNQSLFNVTQHYFQLLAPDVTLNRCSPGGSDPVDYGASTMLQNYTTTGALTYLHITENRADVGIS